MPRALRHQYPGAVYYLMACGDGGKVIFENDEDRKGFLYRLGQVCGSHGWRVHAWVLMGNHWIAERLVMGHTGALSRLLGGFQRSQKKMKSFGEPEKML